MLLEQPRSGSVSPSLCSGPRGSFTKPGFSLFSGPTVSAGALASSSGCPPSPAVSSQDLRVRPQGRRAHRQPQPGGDQPSHPGSLWSHRSRSRQAGPVPTTFSMHQGLSRYSADTGPPFPAALKPPSIPACSQFLRLGPHTQSRAGPCDPPFRTPAKPWLQEARLSPNPARQAHPASPVPPCRQASCTLELAHASLPGQTL